MNRFAIAVLIGCLTIFGTNAFGAGMCAAAFTGEHESIASPRTNPFPVLKRPEVPSLYINRELIAKNQWIHLEGKSYIVRDYYPTADGTVLVLEKKSGERKIVNAKKFKRDLIVIDYVRLHELLEYRNDRVINRFIRDHKVSREYAEEIFEQLMKWFYVLHRYQAEGHSFQRAKNSFELGMYNETHRIDEMWHEFILFSIDYTEFGRKYLGYYQHHQPFDHVETRTPSEISADRQLMYQFVRSTLGQRTLDAWFVEQRYSDPNKPVTEHIPPEI